MAADKARGSAITHRRVLAVALPIALSNATVPLLGVVDTAVMGRLSEVHVGAVGLGAIILAFVFGIFNFLRMSTTGLVAQSAGAGDEDEAAAHLVRALVLGVMIGFALAAAQGIIVPAGLWLAPASPQVEDLARVYLDIRLWGMPATIGLFAINGWLIGVEKTRLVLILQLAINLLNAALNILFVIGFGWGVAGVAWASLIAEIAGFGFALWLAHGALLRVLRLTGGRVLRLFTRDRVERLMRVNGDIMLRSVLLQASFVSFVFFGAAEGDLVLAANQVLLQLVEITAFALDGFAFSAEVLVGQAIGARKLSLVRQASRLSSVWGAGGAVLLMLVFAVFGDGIINLLTTVPALRDEAGTYLPWLIFFPVMGIAAWMLDGIFIGATLTAEMRRGMLVSVGIYLLALLLLPPLLGNHGLWICLFILNGMRAVVMFRWYPRVEALAMAPQDRSLHSAP